MYMYMYVHVRYVHTYLDVLKKTENIKLSCCSTLIIGTDSESRFRESENNGESESVVQAQTLNREFKYRENQGRSQTFNRGGGGQRGQ